ncbi:succinylglutamate desuccinylase [Vibrio tapetis subsp. quintayensis]|uniref:succinylglutamate desuccinylase n=1 Tax=Vibrio tapetis TaxID=52443 RepID=UPI0025B6127D|nr:succinylglutamate desuccinylase [Vibrio tapetis]MDN3679271.1 succinylglutamate desuccinylase [Vibrio tapetis subsp. quintayensis]
MQTAIFENSFLNDTLNFKLNATKGVYSLSNGAKLNILARGVAEYVPETVGLKTKHIIISTGIHGNETAPIELVAQMVEDIISGSLQPLHRCLFIIAHPESTNAETRFIDENLNRLFGEKSPSPLEEPAKGDPAKKNSADVVPKTVESVIAEALKEYVTDFYHGTEAHLRWHLDLHCAIRTSQHYTFAVSPHTEHKVRSQELFTFLTNSKIEAALLSNAASSTFSWYSGHVFAAQALTMELGQVAKLGCNDLSRIESFKQGLTDLICASNSVLKHNDGQGLDAIKLYRVNRTINRTQEEFSFTFDNKVANFTAFSMGELIGFDGETLLYADAEGEAVVFPNANVAIGQRAALMVVEADGKFENEQLVYN